VIGSLKKFYVEEHNNTKNMKRKEPSTEEIVDKKITFLCSDSKRVQISEEAVRATCSLFTTQAFSSLEEEYEVKVPVSSEIALAFRKFLHIRKFGETENDNITWFSIAVLCDFLDYEKGRKMIVEALYQNLQTFVVDEKFLESSINNIKLFYQFKEKLFELWERVQKEFREIFQREERIFQLKEIPDETLSCFDTLERGEGIRNREQRFSTCCKHSLAVHTNNNRKEQKIRKEVIRHLKSTTLHRELSDAEKKLEVEQRYQLKQMYLCWNRSLHQKTITFPESDICTKFCCEHFTESDLPFRNRIKEYNLQKRTAYLLYSTLPKEIRDELCNTTLLVL
jgi:hypothetical protein